MNSPHIFKLFQVVALTTTLFSAPLVAADAVVAKPLLNCRWASLTKGAEEKEDLQYLAEQLSGSLFLGGGPTASAAAKALKAKFDPTKIKSEIELAKYIDALMKLRNWTPEMRQLILGLHPKRAVMLLTRHDGSILPLLDAADKKYGGKVAAFLGEALSDSERLNGQSVYDVVWESLQVYPLPEATIGVIDLGDGLKSFDHLNKGTGASSYVYRGTFAGRTVAIKIQRDGRHDSLAEDDFKVLESLRPLGGPEVYGMVRLRDERGVWRRGVALELVPGKDLLSLRFEQRGGMAPSLKVTAAHVAAFEALINRVEKDHLELADIQPGDFMLKADGRIVPLDMKVVPHPKNADGSLNPRVQSSLRFLREHLDSLKALQAYGSGF